MEKKVGKEEKKEKKFFGKKRCQRCQMVPRYTKRPGKERVPKDPMVSNEAVCQLGKVEQTFFSEETKESLGSGRSPERPNSVKRGYLSIGESRAIVLQRGNQRESGVRGDPGEASGANLIERKEGLILVRKAVGEFLKSSARSLKFAGVFDVTALIISQGVLETPWHVVSSNTSFEEISHHLRRSHSKGSQRQLPPPQPSHSKGSQGINYGLS